MAKVERLMHLLELITGTNNMTVAEMSDACGVSERTIYRYLNTISTLKLQISTHQGYKRTSSGIPLDANTHIKEPWIAAKCIADNDLKSCPVFESKVKKWGINKYHPRPSVKVKNDFDINDPVKLITLSNRGDIKNRELKLLKIAVEAINESKEVEITLNSPHSNSLIIQLDAIRLASNGIWLVGRFPCERRTSVIGLSEIRDISIKS